MRVLLWSVLLTVANTTTTLDIIPTSNKDIPNVTSTPKERIYLPKWSDLDTRPLPHWYDSAKIGIIIHWGVYSVPSFKGEWFWNQWIERDPEIDAFVQKNYGSGFHYKDFTRYFTADLFKPSEWAKLFAKSGAKYVVLTAKHHDGFALFPSQRRYWNSMDVGPRKDIVQVLSKEIRKHKMKFGVYYSLYEWYNKFFLDDKYSGFVTTNYTDDVVWPDIKYLVKKYRPSVLWCDGNWDANYTYWRTPELLTWLYNESPVKNDIVVNDRLGMDCDCRHGDFYNCKDRYNPRDLSVITHKWENVLSLDRFSWGIRRDMRPVDVYSDDELMETIVSTVSCAGNILINVGPTKEGTIPSIFQERLLHLGQWLEINGEAIYNTSPWYYQRDSLNSDVWYTCRKKEYQPLRPAKKPLQTDIINAVYAIFLKWPADDKLRIKDLTLYISKQDETRELIAMLKLNKYKALKHLILNDTTEIDLPEKPNNTINAWVLKYTIHDDFVTDDTID